MSATITSADDVVRHLVEGRPEVTFMIVHPEAGLVLCSLQSEGDHLGDLRLEAYDEFATMALSDASGDTLLETEVFYSNPERSSENMSFLLDMIGRLESRSAPSPN